MTGDAKCLGLRGDEKLLAAIHEAQTYGVNATSDTNQKVLLQAAVRDAALGTAGAVERPPYPTGEADKKLAEDWYTWGFQAGLDSRSAPSPAALKALGTKPDPVSQTVQGEQ